MYSGGGGGSYGVVLSMTVKLHPDGPVAGAGLIFNTSLITNELFWHGINAFHTMLEPIVDDGNSILYEITNNTFLLYSANAPDKSQAELMSLLIPFMNKLTALGIPFTFSETYFDSWYDHYAHYYGPLPYGPFEASQFTSSRLIPRSVAKEKSVDLGAVLKDIVHDNHFYLGCFAFNPNSTTHTPNAVLPAWRTALLHCIISGPWDYSIPHSEMLAREDVLTNHIDPALKALTPGSGTYLNEANFREPNWQQEFYGSNYGRLRDVKRKWDSTDLFFATTAVGSEAWKEDENGRLCRTGV